MCENFPRGEPITRKHIVNSHCSDHYSLLFYPWVICIGQSAYINRKLSVQRDKFAILHYGKCLGSFIEFLLVSYADVIEKKTTEHTKTLEVCNSVKVIRNVNLPGAPCLKIERKCVAGKNFISFKWLIK